MRILRKIIDALFRRRRRKRDNDASIYPMF
jgi:hypothetical protein